MSDTQDQINTMIDRLKAKDAQVQKNLVGFVTRAALRIEREAKLSMKNTPKMSADVRSAMAESGKRVGRKVGRSGKFHMPSEPGNPPAIDQGRLVNSVTHSVDERNVSARVGTNVDYGAALEHGTSRMLARPWLRPAVDTSRHANQEDFRTVMGNGGESSDA